jgi:hypothetical protein
MPPYIYETQEYVEASVKAVYTFEKLAKGHVLLRWYAKIADGTTGLFNDTVLYRKECFLFLKTTKLVNKNFLHKK